MLPCIVIFILSLDLDSPIHFLLSLYYDISIEVPFSFSFLILPQKQCISEAVTSGLLTFKPLSWSQCFFNDILDLGLIF